MVRRAPVGANPAISPWCVAALPLMAHAETDACTLLTRAQVAAAVGGAVSDGTHVTPTFVKTCTWTPSGKSKLGSVTLNLQTAAFYDGGKRQATMAVAAVGKGADRAIELDGTTIDRSVASSAWMPSPPAN